MCSFSIIIIIIIILTQTLEEPFFHLGDPLQTLALQLVGQHNLDLPGKEKFIIINDFWPLSNFRPSQIYIPVYTYSILIMPNFQMAKKKYETTPNPTPHHTHKEIEPSILWATVTETLRALCA